MANTPCSVWLLPPAAERARYTRLIETLSRRLGTPMFEPHLTLSAPHELSEAEAARRTQQLAEDLAPVPVQLTDVGITDAYFRCLYLRAERTAALFAAHMLACRHLAQPPEPDFLPHLSLVYGTLPAPQKEPLAEELASELPAAFVVGHIGLYQIAGPPYAWRLIQAFALTGKTG